MSCIVFMTFKVVKQYLILSQVIKKIIEKISDPHLDLVRLKKAHFKVRHENLEFLGIY